MSFLPKYTKKKAVKRYSREKEEEEQMLFLALCSEQDRKLLICDDEKLDLEDFERILYLVDLLDLTYYLHYLYEKHPKLQGELYNKIICEVESKDFNLNKELKIVDRWVKEFCENIPVGAMMEYIEKQSLGGF